MSLSEIVSEGLRLTRKNSASILLLIACMRVPSNLFQAFWRGAYQVGNYSEATVSALALGISLIDSLFSLVVFIGLAYLVESSLKGAAPSMGNILQFSFSRFKDVFLTNLLVSIYLLGLTLLLIVPGIIWSNFYAFVPSIVALRSISGQAALDYSKRLVQGQWWRIFGIFFAVVLIGAIINLPLFIFSRRTSEIIFLGTFVPLTFFDIVSAIVVVISVVLFLNTEHVRDLKKQRRLEC